MIWNVAAAGGSVRSANHGEVVLPVHDGLGATLLHRQPRQDLFVARGKERGLQWVNLAENLFPLTLAVRDWTPVDAKGAVARAARHTVPVGTLRTRHHRA